MQINKDRWSCSLVAVPRFAVVKQFSADDTVTGTQAGAPPREPAGPLNAERISDSLLLKWKKEVKQKSSFSSTNQILIKPESFIHKMWL